MAIADYPCFQRDFLLLKRSLQVFESQTPHEEITKSYQERWVPRTCSDGLADCVLLFQYRFASLTLMLAQCSPSLQHLCEHVRACAYAQTYAHACTHNSWDRDPHASVKLDTLSPQNLVQTFGWAKVESFSLCQVQGVNQFSLPFAF